MNTDSKFNNMKIKVLIISLAAVFAAAGVVLFMNLKGDNNPYFDENLEALMESESVSAAVNCAGEGQIYCPLTNTNIFREVTYTQI